ncbi:nuclear transport factor 2 family protein [Planktothrix agardhii]|uniref:nuclear transport factor 2 family protein n=1 Tax=Planktothrix agardhii TaxID=1160 RepID=UPI001D0A8D10|nr:SgcJ/EcaC family oxidoreductase [Planktothrix agardhii]MCB8762121.1 SgcJ/EcaC family oxidoreductase [Planktothrix agardhii 1813]
MSYVDKEKIREVFEEVYPSNIRSCDLQGYADMYTEDALWMMPNVPDRHGVPEIVEGFAESVAKQDIDSNLTAEEIEVIGDFGYVLGISLSTIYPQDGSPSKQLKCREVWLMKKEQEEWKISRQIQTLKPS